MTFSALDSGLTGPLFATEAMRACFSDTAILAAMAETEAALARAEAGLALAPALLGNAIIEAAPQLRASAIRAGTALAGVPSIPFVKQLQAALPTALAPFVHKGATTQDLMDTASILCVRQGLDLVQTELDAILTGLIRLAAAHRDTPCVGRTYGQHAAPLTFGFKVAVWLTGIAELRETLPDLRRRALVASLGGPVGTLAGLGRQGPAVLEAFAAELGLGTTPIAWHTLRGRVAETGAWLARLIGALAKMATDVASLASTDIGEVAEPHMPGRGGSTAMPHKRNPVSSTVILAAHAAAPGHAAMLTGCMAAAHERPAGLWHAEWHALPTLFGLASGALAEARSLAEGLCVDAMRMRANIDLTHGLVFADGAAAHLVPVLGREGAHARIAQAADEVRRTGIDLREALRHDFPETAMDAAFDLAEPVAAAGPWVDRAVAFAAFMLAERGYEGG